MSEYKCFQCGQEAAEHDQDNFPCKMTEADVLREHLRKRADPDENKIKTILDYLGHLAAEIGDSAKVSARQAHYVAELPKIAMRVEWPGRVYMETEFDKMALDQAYPEVVDQFFVQTAQANRRRLAAAWKKDKP